MWALRYKPLHQEDPPRLRLLILSRNLTRDRSWDISLILDGVGTKSPQAVNRPLSDFVRGLTDLAVAGLPDGTRALPDGLAEARRPVKGDLPGPLQGVGFAVNVFGGRRWRPTARARVGGIGT